MNELQSYIYEFGDFRVDAAKRLLMKREGETIPLTPKVYDTLLYLVEHHGTVLDKDALMQAIWPHTVVEENNLNQSISALRRVFGESPGENRYIANVPGRGYCFVAPVKKAASPESHEERESTIMTSQAPQPADNGRSRSLPIVLAGIVIVGLGFAVYHFWPVAKTLVSKTPDSSSPIKTTSSLRLIAVLPFKPLVADHRDQSLEMGMADTLIVRLGNLSQVRVRPLSSVRKFSGLEQYPITVGNELVVESILDG